MDGGREGAAGIGLCERIGGWGRREGERAGREGGWGGWRTVAAHLLQHACSRVTRACPVHACVLVLAGPEPYPSAGSWGEVAGEMEEE